MAEWLYEAGIGEARAALVEDGVIVEARIELESDAPRVGAVLPARLVEITVKGREGRVTFAGGEAMLSPLPPGITQGAALTIEIVREAIPEPGRVKLPRAAPSDAPPAPGSTLLERITASGVPVRTCLPHQPDALEAAGWSEVLDEAMTGDIAFPGGMLRMIPTPAMTLFDVDGSGPLEALAVAAARAVAAAIVRHDIGGSIGVDFPTVAGKGPRQAIAAAIDAGLPQPFERTAVNGFGFLQIVRKRSRIALPELLRADPAGAAARTLLRQIERTPPPVPPLHRVSPAMAKVLAAHPHWRDAAARATGADIRFESN
ncbi:ribonuclease [Sphingomonas immobilis]|uniref:Ribonuclease n=1 Tax=Sphingomonas immobilis TaxID=3063997 RepID=A0ABT9A2V4_9SPHN|nr:ribonuclease [Sphingomonas sp. CA1-15]MDO7844135.1 ribonuclease [Sphingomonas sp. CA1-15]